MGVRKCERVLLLPPQGLDYIAGFYGALMAGVIPVTLPAPRSRRSVERVRLVAADCAPVAMLVTQAQQEGLKKAIAAVPALATLPQVALDVSLECGDVSPLSAAVTCRGSQNQSMEAQNETSLVGGATCRADHSGDMSQHSKATAFLQYTSGSTSQPKGVMVTHANLAHQCAMLGAASGMDAETIMISWLPLNHDMGLLAVLAPLFHGGRTVLLPSNAVLQRPLLWLETAAREKATMLVGPDFGYMACASAAEKNGLPPGLDLSTLTTVWTGAEPVRAETLERFTAAFAPAGFRAEMWRPCYGMAETTLMATGHRVGTAPVVKVFDAAALAEGVAVPSAREADRGAYAPSRVVVRALAEHLKPNAQPDSQITANEIQAVQTETRGRGSEHAEARVLPRTVANSRLLTSCGTPHDGMKIAIVNFSTHERLSENHVGEIWVRGESVAAGYFGKETLTQELFRAELLDCGSGPPQSKESWLRTGDLGFLHDGQLFPCGRLKDMIKLRGRNLYPQDIEAVIAAVLPWLAPNGCTAFVVEKDGAEAIGVLIEADRALAKVLKTQQSRRGFQPLASDDKGLEAPSTFEETLGLIRQAVTEETEAAPALIAFTGPTDFPRTTSGKVQRHAAKQIATTAGDARVLFITGPAAPVTSECSDMSELSLGETCRADQSGDMSPHSKPTTMPDITSILTALRTFGEHRLNSRIADERRTFPPHVILDLAELGLFGIRVPQEFGGLGLSCRDMFRITQQLAAIDVTLAIMVGIHNGLGLEPIVFGGSETVKRDVLPVLASGRGLASFALTEYGGGSNPRALTTIARRVPGGFVITGHKLWIGLASWARTITVIANAVDEAGRPLGSIACLVHRDNPGLLVGDEFLTLGMRAIPQNHVDFVEAFVPEEDLLGAVGEGWQVARKGMLFAVLGISTIACGAMKRCTQLLRLYASQRQVSGGRLLDTAATRERLDWMVNAITTADSFFDHCSTTLDGGGELHEAFYLAAKTTVPEWLGIAADWTLQALGGAGYTETNEIARLVRDARILRIFEGPSEALCSHLGALARRSTAEIHACLESFFPETSWPQKNAESEEEMEQGIKSLRSLRSLAANDATQQLADLIATAPQADNVAIGRFTAELMLLAAVLGKHGAQHPAVLWQQKRCRQLAEETRSQTVPVAADELEQSIAAFEADIGTNRVRRAGGEDHQPHPFMNLDCGSLLPLSVPQPAAEAGAAGHAEQSGSRLPQSTEFLPIVTATLLSVLRDQVDGSFTTLDPDAPLTRYGMDSLATVEAALRLEKATGLKLPPDLLVQTQTAREVAAMLAGESSPLAPQQESFPSNGSTPPKSLPFPQRMAQAMERVNQLRAADRYPFHTVSTETSDGHIVVNEQRMVMMGSYEYLSIGGHPKLVAAMNEIAARHGTGSHGSMIMTGTTAHHQRLNEKIAQLMNADEAMVFTSGYLANSATAAAFTGPGDVVIGDALNHASIVDGCRLSGARFVSFAHNDLAALERLLIENEGMHTLVVVDGVFSMDGDFADLPNIARLCKQHGAYLMVDEAHALGTAGKTGRGVQEHFGLPADAIDLKMGTLSKALGGIGGFVAGKAEIIDYLRHQARGYLFASALPAPNAAASLAALDVLEQEPWRVERLQANARRWRDGLKALGYDTFASETPIVPVRMPDETAAFEFAYRCKERGVFVVPVVFPAVPQNAPRLRTCVTAGLTDADLDLALEVFAKTGRELGVVSR